MNPLNSRARRAVLALAAAGLLSTQALAENADTILRNGKIYTVDKSFSAVQAVAIKAGRFVAVGDDASVMKEAGAQTQVIDLGGRTVVPGLIDSHLHQSFAATNLPAVQLLDARSIADVQKLIGERAKQTPPGEWVVASSGWHESLLKEGRLPTRYELDEVAPNNPVLIPRGGHVVTINTKALELAGVTKDSTVATFSADYVIPEFVFIAFQATFAAITAALVLG
jgi:predicted amidohydrolase YtcJ